MQLRWSTIRDIALFVAIIVMLVSIKQCRDNGAQYEESKSYLASLNDSITYLKNGVAQKPAVGVSADLFAQIVNERDDLKQALKEARVKEGNVHTLTQVVTNTQIDTITVKLHDTIPCADFAPIPFAVDSQYYSISGKVGKKAVTLSKVSFPDSLYIITSDKRHIFKKNEFLVSVDHSNPLVKTVGLMHLNVTSKPKWWENSWIKMGLGFAIGAYATKTILR